MKKLLAILIAALILCQALAPAAFADSETPSVEKKEYTVYFGDLDTYLEEDFPLYFVNGAQDMPYTELSDFAHLLIIMNQEYLGDEGYSLRCIRKGSVFRFKRENGYTADFDFQNGTIVFSDYDAFIHGSTDSTLIDLVSESDFDAEGTSQLYRRNLSASFDRYGDVITLDLNAYHIPMLWQDGKYYVPFQTLNDFLISVPMNESFVFNGRALMLGGDRYFFDADGERTAMGDYYYDVPSRQRSEALAEYSYDELCLLLDSIYGLKETHDITNFSQLFWQIGFDEPLLSRDPEDADTALYHLISYYLDDLHSCFNGISCLCEGIDVPELGGAADRKYDDHLLDYEAARSLYYPDGVPGYEEVGNTAYVTFDSFDSDYYSAAFYAAASMEDLPDDTVGLLIYANSRINHEDSPIENVVLDLSVNGGGAVDAAAAVLAWYLGEASFSVKNTFTGALSNSVYQVDLNLDHEFDDLDTVRGKHLYCLISPLSFSCGNLVPAALKSSQRVTLLGKTSGGGSCTVQPLTTAYGTMFQISGSYRMSFLKNGSFYDIDQGVEPDCYIDDLASYYDRQALTDYINELF